ncbi:hypothetical protein [Mycolicibacterium moriokaense]|uniref:Uncharacterized protein n=1 Tax=Mycolicibacterium moriokaense TaxID=39691 RepID=A0A318H0Q4_9MYCO|nr:hypothetical protein [Mycolicibacterium moriokaense]PXW94802.1 hypothetical protein C8E89_1643 [Mycolicibacterium moriokaense]
MVLLFIFLLLACVAVAAVSALVWVVGRRRDWDPDTKKRAQDLIWLGWRWRWPAKVSKGQTLAATLIVAGLLVVVIVLAVTRAHHGP